MQAMPRFPPCVPIAEKIRACAEPRPMPKPFRANFPGRCGICRMRIRKGDEVVWIPPTSVEVLVAYDYEKQRGGWSKQVPTKLAHASCTEEQADE